MSIGKTERAQRAANSLADGSVVGMGSYKVHENGATSSSLKAVLASGFVRHHDLESGDGLDVWLDADSGALILLPEGHDES